jgi:fucose 4-O-acetylase-like acetyltransferase
MSSKRIGYLDIAKGLGILLVVLGHNDLKSYAPLVFKIVYSFHMPLFFFISGMFFKPETPFIQLIKKRFHTLVKPYFFSILLIYFVALFFSGTMGFYTIGYRIAKAFYGTGYYLDWVQMWFIPALFVVNLVAFGFYRLLRRFPDWINYIGLLGLLAVGVWTIGWFYPYQMPFLNIELKGLPWNLDLALVAGFYYLLGFQVRQQVSERIIRSRWLLLGTAIINLVIVINLSSVMDLDKRSYPYPILSTVACLAGIFFILSLSYWLDKGPSWLVSSLKYIGMASLIILIFHAPIQSYLTKKMVALMGGSTYVPLIVFPFAVLVPLLLYALFIRPNPALAWLYGLHDKFSLQFAGEEKDK